MAEGLVVLDVGETLVSGPPTGPARRIAARLGLDDGARRTLHRALMTTPFEAPDAVEAFVAEQLGVDPGDAVAEVWRAQEREPEPIAGAAEAVAGLAAAGLRLALASNIWRPYLVGVRRHLGALLDAHVPRELQSFSFLAGVAKPDPALYERLLRRAGVPAGRSVMVGDSHDKDIAPAAALGMKTIWIDRAGTLPSIADLDADRVRALWA